MKIRLHIPLKHSGKRRVHLPGLGLIGKSYAWCIRKKVTVLAEELHCFPRLRPVRLFLHREVPAIGKARFYRGYSVTEPTTGLKVSAGRTKRDAIRNSRERFDEHLVGAKKLVKSVRMVMRAARFEGWRKRCA